MPFGSWKDTESGNAFGHLPPSEATEHLKAGLQLCMPDNETILRSAATSPSDFTLHVEEHSFRVASNMAEIIPSDVLPALSVQELAMLLLSSYLHDIGMSPERKRVAQHHELLISGSTA